MGNFDKATTDLLEGMALKIVMIEPGDLSVVGDILSQIEWLLSTKGVMESPDLLRMGKKVQEALEKTVMNDLPDTPSSYEAIGECIGIMQETCRTDGQAGEKLIISFCQHLTKIGYKVDPSMFGMATCDQDPGGSRAKEANARQEAEIAFLKDREMATGFVDEASEHLETIDKTVVALEKDSTDSDAIHRILRAFHSIKGIAQCLDLQDVSELSHSVENLLTEVRSGIIPMDSGVVDIILRAADCLRVMVRIVDDTLKNGPDKYEVTDFEVVVRSIQKFLSERSKEPQGIEEPVSPPTGQTGQPAAGTRETVERRQDNAEKWNELNQIDVNQDKDLISGFVDESTEHLESIEVNVLELEQNPNDIEIINRIFRPFHTIKGVSGFLNLKAINKLAHTTENLLDDVRNGVREMSPQVIDVVLGVGDCLKSMIKNIRAALESGQEYYNAVDITPWIEKITAIREGPGPMPTEKVDAPVVLGKEMREEKGTAPPEEGAGSHGEPEGLAGARRIVMPETPQPPPQTADRSQMTNEVRGGKAQQKLETTIKVGVEKLDALVNAVGELVIMLSLVQENPAIRKINNPKLSRDFSQLSRITSELQKTSMAMRMVPISQTFQKMIRLVRDLSKKSGKKVELRMEGEETEIDRNMVDSIYDPLVHMIRNSVDHGVQVPSERVKLGKPESGTVFLRAYQRGGNMVIEIEDDGNGLNPQKIRAKAIERGLIQSHEELSDHDLNNLIFLPGFSTADKITDVSGRGVGMDVVKKAVEKLRGKVEVISEVGMGSKFIIRLPLTLAIIDGIIVRVGLERYIIPTIAIQESIKPLPEQYTTVHNRGEALLIRQHLVPIIRLYEMFNVESSTVDPYESIMVVVENEGARRALMVDEVLGKQEVVIKSLGGLTDIRGVAGGTILGDGRVGLILDLAGLVSGGTA